MIYVFFLGLLICVGAWFLHSTDHQSEPTPDSPSVQEETENPAENSLLDNVDITEKTDETDIFSSDNPERFELKKEADYIQLRLAITSSEGKVDEVEEYLEKNLHVDANEDSLGNTYFAFPRENYDFVLSTIIDCPYTENVNYKNEDYYPVACEIYNNSEDGGILSKDAIQDIENIEKMCEKIIITIK